MFRTNTQLLAVPAIALTALLAWQAPTHAQETPLPTGIEVQASGPIHEAFAQPVAVNPEPSAPVPRQPPDPVAEEPPELRPEGDNVQWIPGYWAWDSGRNDFLWVSGVWRNAPPGQTFVAGYWAQGADGWRWVSGSWTGARQSALSYDPAPPASLENGPSVPAPDDNSTYVAGCWDYQGTTFAWRPGYWMPDRPGMVWMPAHYLWTPAGYLFIPGYWDYPLEQRGLLFAPVAFSGILGQQPGWVYQPAYVVDPSPLLSCLFVGPGSASYYFGDYYHLAGTRGAFQAWFSFGHGSYDPLYSYYRSQHRRDPGWDAGLRQVYLERTAGRAAVPPRTLVQQNVNVNVNNRSVNNTTIINNHTAARSSINTSLTLLTPLSRTTTHLTAVTATQRQANLAAAQSANQAVASRRQVESRAVLPRASAPVVAPRTAAPTLRVPSASQPTIRTSAPRRTASTPVAPIPAQGTRTTAVQRVTTTRVAPAVHAPLVAPKTTMASSKVSTITRPAGPASRVSVIVQKQTQVKRIAPVAARPAAAPVATGGRQLQQTRRQTQVAPSRPAVPVASRPAMTRSPAHGASTARPQPAVAARPAASPARPQPPSRGARIP